MAIGTGQSKAKPYLNPAIPVVQLFLGDQQKPLNVIPDFLEGFEEENLTNGRSQATMTLFDPGWDFLESIALSNQSKVRYKFGWRLGPQRELTSTRLGRITSFQNEFSYQGNRVRFTINEVGDTKDSQVFTRTWPSVIESPDLNKVNEFSPDKKSGIKISDIARRIAKEMDLSDTLDSDIEETKSVQIYNQIGKSNFNFLNDLAKIAISKESGRSDYYFDIRSNRMLFKTTNYERIVRSYNYARDMSGEVLRFIPTANFHLGIFGSQDPTAVSWNPLKKKLLKLQQGWGRDDRVALAKERRAVPGVTKGTAGRLYVLPYERVEFVEGWLRNKFEELSRFSRTAQLVIVGDPNLNPRDIIQIIVRKDDGDIHYTSGRYIILKAINIITAGSYVTQLDLVSDGSLKDGITNEGIKKDMKVEVSPNRDVTTVKTSVTIKSP